MTNDDSNGEQQPPEQSEDDAHTSKAPQGEDTTDWKSEARKWESRAKANSEAAKELEQLKDAAKSDAERQSEALATAQRERDEAVTQATRLEVAAEYGLTAKQLRWLPRTGSYDEIAEDAKALKAELAEAAEASDQPRRPKPDPHQGRSDDETADKDALARQVFGLSS